MEETIPEIIEAVAREVPFELLLVFSFILLFSLIFRRLGQPAVMGCFVGGFVLQLLSHFAGVDLTHQLELESEIIFLLIGLLIFNEGLSVEMDYLVKNKEEIGALAIVGTFVGVALCGALLRVLFGLEWVVAIIVGTMLIPTDAGAVLAVLSRFGVGERWRSMIAGESIFNDPISLILFGLAVGVWQGEQPHWLAAILRNVVGSCVLGGVLGYLFYRLYRLMNDPVSELILSGMLFTAAFFVAEYFHMSGFLSVAVASIFVGNRKTLCMEPETVETLDRFWEALAIAIEGFLFVMIGAAIPLDNLIRHVGLGLVAIGVVTAARSVTVHSLLWSLDRFFRQDIPWRWRVIVDLGGLHVGVTMAILLNLPKDLPWLEEIQVMGYYVITWSVLGMPFLGQFALKALGLKSESHTRVA
jgi:CPA1 family monovalent cation:H+ antiporter